MKKMKFKKRKFTSKDDEELRLCLTIALNEDKEVDYEILDKKYPIIEWRSEYLTTKPQYDETEEVEDVYLNVVIRKLAILEQTATGKGISNPLMAGSLPKTTKPTLLGVDVAVADKDG
ncbi:hypothetical protein Tco_1127972 [Tanacetum coccineum]